ncbi:MAG: response regulator [Opitutaceae bacterium]|jgi:CheY-like chemotaxis protein
MPFILLIDDDEPFRLVLKASMERMGHEVTVAKDGREGVALYMPSAFDLVITDLIMPEKEGIETIMDLRKRSPAVKIIAMSGGGRVTSVDYLKIARQVGAQSVLEKPFRYEELKTAIEKALAPPASAGQG